MGGRLDRGEPVALVARPGWSSSDWRQFLVLALPVIAYVLCAVGGGSGFIGAWAAGLAFAIHLRRTPPARVSVARTRIPRRAPGSPNASASSSPR